MDHLSRLVEGHGQKNELNRTHKPHFVTPIHDKKELNKIKESRDNLFLLSFAQVVSHCIDS